MHNAVTVLQILISVFLITLILLQNKGGGLGSTFGQGQEQYRTRRGMEKILHFGTIFLAFLFLISSLLLLVIK